MAANEGMRSQELEVGRRKLGNSDGKIERQKNAGRGATKKSGVKP